MIQFGADFSTNGVPETGLSPIITIRDTSDGSIVINDGAMIEVGGGAYKYDFSNNIAKKYRAIADGGVDTLNSRYMTAWSERAKAEAEIVDALADTHELQTNQGNWLTATGFSTHNAAAVKTAMEADGAKLTDLHDEAFGKWTLDSAAKTLTLYKADGVSILKIFDLTSAGGSVPAFIEREPQ